MLVLVVMTACAPPKPGAESDESPGLIEAQCDGFCERAIACESEEYAAQWEFTTRSECVEDCLVQTEVVVEALMEPSCETIIGAKWECAGMIEECQVWRSYEDAAFGMIAIDGNPCQDEVSAVVDDCNP